MVDWGADVDTYQVALKTRTTLIARMDAYVLGSTVDPLMRLLDADGRVLAINHDHYHLDPFIAFDVSGRITITCRSWGSPTR